MPPKLKFAENEKVLCFHGPLIYEAKVLKSQITKEMEVEYLIHYAGWNKNWDEWVSEYRVLEFNEANIARQKEIAEQHSTATKNEKQVKKKNSGSPSNVNQKETKSEPSTNSNARDSKPSSSAEQTPIKDLEASLEIKAESKIKIPEELKSWLVDDWETITHKLKLIELPAKTTVQDVMDGYMAQLESIETNDASNKEPAVQDIALGIVEYFNVMLGANLLYKFERPQYEEILKKNPNIPMSKIYGPFHLLRLFVKLNSLLVYTALDEKSLETVVGHVQDLLEYLAKESQILFNASQYIDAPPKYYR